jgi:DNA-binding MarR family transcriptional regulator
MRDSVDDHVETWSKELGVDPTTEAIVARMHKITRHLSQNRTTALRSDDLNMWQFKTLLMVRRQGAPYEISPSDLARVLGLTRGALSTRLGALEQRGLLEREHGRDDRRRVTVRLTRAGHDAVESMSDKEEAGEGALLSVLTEREKATLSRLLRKLLVTIETG